MSLEGDKSHIDELHDKRVPARIRILDLLLRGLPHPRAFIFGTLALGLRNESNDVDELAVGDRESDDMLQRERIRMASCNKRNV